MPDTQAAESQPASTSLTPGAEEDLDPDALRFFNRSPHPYHRRSNSLRSNDRPTYSPSEPTTPQEQPIEQLDGPPATESSAWRKQSGVSQSSSDSGSEADDESYTVVKALPAPPIKHHKGLRNSRGDTDGGNSPLLSPAQVDEDGLKYASDYFELKKDGTRDVSPPNEEAIAARQRYVKRRRAELLRRTTEVALTGGIAVAVIGGSTAKASIYIWHRELLVHIWIVPALATIYFARLLFFRTNTHGRSRLSLGQRIKIPAAFDPATLLYPVLLPVMVALSITPAAEHTILPNIILSLSAIPPRLIPFGARGHGYNMLHWLISILPLIVSEHTEWPSKIRAAKPYLLKSGPPEGLHPDMLATLFALHQALLPPLQYLTTTSLLPAELQLLSIAMINILFFAESPQTTILTLLLWVGGLGIFVLCGKVLTWGVQLARIPRWRFRRVGRIIQARQTFLKALNAGLSSTRPADTDSDEDIPLMKVLSKRRQSLRLDTFKALLPGSLVAQDDTPKSAGDVPNGKTRSNLSQEGKPTSRKRSHTLPSVDVSSVPSRQPSTSHRKRHRSSAAKSLLGLTQAQATTRKWMYAGYVYMAIIGIILGPVRYLVGERALGGSEPFGWAIGYLFGGIPTVRDIIWELNLEWWIPLPRIRHVGLDESLLLLGRADFFRIAVIGEANTRLLLCGYCVFILGSGMVTVLGLPEAVEVDTRRKVFHGMMVAMLLPTIFVDPAFVALALGLILAVFLLLDLIRASQLPPLSKPLAYFLQPYVDGRDLRGPVVVSHIFLLIGCAIPLWLSLGSNARGGNGPWEGWEVEGRDVSMVSGVVCVGMGDAAASLIGRRYGRRKWPWAGGKSLEGSAAFAAAVMGGLLFGKVWLRTGQWEAMEQHARGASGEGNAGMDGLLAVAKAAVCACGASVMEAVLTGGNDNVIVPVVLWLLVRGLRL